MIFHFLCQGRNTLGLIPVTVKQISEASHSGEEKASFVINGAEASNVLPLFSSHEFAICVLKMPRELHGNIRFGIKFVCETLVFDTNWYRLRWLGWFQRKLQEILTLVSSLMMERDGLNA